MFAEAEAELFEEQRDSHKERKDKLEEAIDHVRAKLGDEAVKTGRRLFFEARKQKRDVKNNLCHHHENAKHLTVSSKT